MRWKTTPTPVHTALLTATLLAAPALAQDDPARNLIVGTKVAEPFVIRDTDGNWSGLSIELWENLANDQGWTFEYRELPLDRLLAATADGSIDLAVAAVTVTPERETRMDFTHPFHTTGLGLAVPARPGSNLVILRSLLSPAFLSVVASLLVLLTIVGLLAWLAERRGNPEQFGGRPTHGIGAGLWWSAVTMTTVGYGDKAPVTFWGRVLALVWMFAGIIMISTFTAAIASSLTSSRLETLVDSADDLPGVRMGAIGNSAPEATLRARDLNPRTFADLKAALEELESGGLDVVVHDAPILRFMVQQEFQGEIHVLDATFDRQDYALALPPGSPLREPLNRALLQEIGDERWRDLLDRYLGR